MVDKDRNTDIDDDILYRLDDEVEDDNSYILPEYNSEKRGSHSDTAYYDSTDTENQEGAEGEEEDEEGDETEDSGDDQEKLKGKVGFSLLFKILATPVEGWKEMKRRRLSTDSIASSVFYPLVACASASEFIRLIYGSVTPLSDMVKEAVITFMALFFGYFTVLLLGGYLLPKGVRGYMKETTGKNLTMMAFSSLALFIIIYNAFPMIDPVLVFLPLWTIYIVCKGVKILRVPKDTEIRTKGTLCCLIIGAPLLWDWLLSELLNV